jgi:Tol biopolymer transport system component
MSIWRMNADGTNPQKLTENQDVFSLNLSPDAAEIFYTARAESIFTLTLWKMSADGSGQKQLTDKLVYLPKLAPDGKTIACYFPDATSERLELSILSAENGEFLRQIETPRDDHLEIFDWQTDGQNLLVATKQTGGTSLWLQPVDASAPTKLKDWQNENFFRLNVSKDGKNLFYEKGIATNSVLLLRDAK